MDNITIEEVSKSLIEKTFTDEHKVALDCSLLRMFKEFVGLMRNEIKDDGYFEKVESEEVNAAVLRVREGFLAALLEVEFAFIGTLASASLEAKKILEADNE